MGAAPGPRKPFEKGLTENFSYLHPPSFREDPLFLFAVSDPQSFRIDEGYFAFAETTSEYALYTPSMTVRTL